MPGAGEKDKPGHGKIEPEGYVCRVRDTGKGKVGLGRIRKNDGRFCRSYTSE
jgi:hypothetical protein